VDCDLLHLFLKIKIKNKEVTKNVGKKERRKKYNERD
jgi:hypothetical protein